ncbi:MAG: LysM peptidoglycan-binding domain-containing protein [Verrucomicrobia bacterium]|nr:LysM peptidoglycan-binding domain-containing protein [Verrucomicrobiota bacterium]
MNVILIAFCIYEWREGGVSILALVDYRPQEIATKGPLSSPQLVQEAENLKAKSFAEVCNSLSDTTAVSDGYTRRDIALAVLTSLHHFNIEKALQGYTPRQKVQLTASSQPVTIFAGLLDEHYSLIADFVREEKWPFTSEGLYLRLRKTTGYDQDPSLRLAFCQTEEYHRLSLLLTRDADIKEEQILPLILEVDWSFIAQASKPRKLTLEESREVKRCFLLRAKKANPEPALLVPVKQVIAEERPPIPKNPVKKAPPETVYTVQYGDSLWSISRKFHVDIEAIKKVNQLHSDALKPGDTLRIPG